MSNKIGWATLFALLAALPGNWSAALADETMSLAGQWRFQLDRSDAGLDDRWYDRTLAESIRLPGSLPAQGVGDEVTVDTKWTGNIVDRSWFTSPEYEPYRQPGHVKIPFWLQPEKYYAGVAWYQRDVDIPDACAQPARRARLGTPALGDTRLDRRAAGRRLQRPLHAAPIRSRSDHAGQTPPYHPRR